MMFVYDTKETIKCRRRNNIRVPKDFRKKNRWMLRQNPTRKSDEVNWLMCIVFVLALQVLNLVLVYCFV